MLFTMEILINFAQFLQWLLYYMQHNVIERLQGEDHWELGVKHYFNDFGWGNSLK